MQYTAEDTDRWAAEPPKSPTRTDFERDRARVLHSSALRRLGAKTQVLGPESDDFIRTRLTHSLEVAQVGRSLAKNLGCDPDIVETACLCHDIGHPPYGHNGEKALAEISESFGGFEGNAQTLRVLSRLEPKRFHPDGRPAGLNLTRATLDATLKYPWRRGEGPDPDSPKFGVYDDDVDAFRFAHPEKAGNTRCVEAQIMDLSDDIAYSVHDIEDAVVRGSLDPAALADAGRRRGIIDVTQEWYGHKVAAADLEGALDRLVEVKSWPTGYTGSLRDLAGLKDLTSDLIGRFVSRVTRATLAEYGGGALGRHNGQVVIPSEVLAEITLLKGLAVYFVMAPREHEPLYYEQRTILWDLVDAISEAPRERLEPAFVEAWELADGEGARQRVVVDQVASLTDQSARQWHARMCGFLRN